MSSKLKGDVRGAIRLAVSGDTVAPFSGIITEALRDTSIQHVRTQLHQYRYRTVTFVYAYRSLMFWPPGSPLCLHQRAD